MEGKEGVRFKVNLSEEGTSKLADRLTLTLKDYMGDFVDDTLVKYVIVLLGNGRSKEEIKEDLDVFLGDSSDSFVTWLWDHLSSDLDQYVQSLVPSANEASKAKLDTAEQNGETDSQNFVSVSEKGKPKSSASRHNRDWKGLMSDETHRPLRNSVANTTQKEEIGHKTVARTLRSDSPEHPVSRKRNREADERARPKREASQTTIVAPRRLLQFAVRDAVATTRPSNPVSEPGRKRLRSVVSTPIGNSSEKGFSQTIHPVPRVSNPMTTAIRAVAEAAMDVRRVKSGNVFSRLSRGVDDTSELVPAYGAPAVQDMKYEDCVDIHGNGRETYVRTRDNDRTYNLDASMIGNNTSLTSDSASENDGYGNVSSRRVMDISETGNSKGSTKHKVVNISVNVNTWKPRNHLPAREVVQAGPRKLRVEDDNGPTDSVARLVKDYANSVTVTGNGQPAVVSQKEVPKALSVPGLNSTGRPLEDADSRTIFVNNVHFAATKDTLSRHFIKFGEVLKVMILTDAATGHPKGSAYVEFMQKEAAENALTLDGTSFMSRIIKVMKKSSAQQEASPMMMWPRNTRGSSFTVTRFTQAPFPRVFSGAYRGRPAVKPGVRSMQWKRDTQQTTTESVVPASGNTSSSNTNTNPPSIGRGLTYVRPLSKTDGNAAGA
ncbi:hypothetical protein vseg_002258 [Gypsophila vaccaria]